MSLATLTAQYLPAIEAELRRVVGSGPPHLHDYYEMLEYHLGWVDGEAGGKRIRPLLCLFTCAAAGGAWQTALPAAAALELLHNFSLIHDDIQDNSPLRRGRPTVWKKWGRAQAINAGDAMFTLAHLAPHGLTAQGLPPERVLGVLTDFDRTCLVLTQGQHLDMTFEARGVVSVPEYLAMIEAKTAALIAAAARLGAKLAEAEAARVDQFNAFGRALGLAFQVQDDLLGIWGDPALTGKSAASDLEKRKKSLPVVYGLEHSEAFARAYAQAAGQGPAVDDMARMLEDLGARAYTEQSATDLTAEARRSLDAARPGGPGADALRELTDQLLGRRQ